MVHKRGLIFGNAETECFKEPTESSPNTSETIRIIIKRALLDRTNLDIGEIEYIVDDIVSELNDGGIY